MQRTVCTAYWHSLYSELSLSLSLSLTTKPTVFNDQLACRPTGCTTAALIVLNHHVAKFLETNSYIKCLMVDFSKSFDSINHVVLISLRNFTSQIMFITGLLIS